jgi:hypothetical protein
VQMLGHNWVQSSMGLKGLVLAVVKKLVMVS